MEKLGVIVPVEEPTEWCSGMVVIPKPNGQVRICVDLTKLNKSIKRGRHPLQAVDQTLVQLAGAKVFTKLDANSGFWQIPLTPESQHLTTFITPFGRYCFTRMPFGITSAPEFFQREMSILLRGLEGVVCQIDDILIYGRNQQEHMSAWKQFSSSWQMLISPLIRSSASSLKGEFTFCGTSLTIMGYDPIQKRSPPSEMLGSQHASVM